MSGRSCRTSPGCRRVSDPPVSIIDRAGGAHLTKGRSHSERRTKRRRRRVRMGGRGERGRDSHGWIG